MYRMTLCAATALLVAAAVQPATADDTPATIARNWYECANGAAEEAVAMCTRLLAVDPGKSDAAYMYRGIAYYRKHDFDRAIADLEESIRLDPKVFNAYIYRGIVYDAKRDYDRAIANYDQAIKIYPNYSVAYNNRGWLYDERGDYGDYDRAIADFNQAIEIYPNFALAHRYRGVTYSKKGEYDRAIADLEEAIRLDPTDQTARQYLERAMAARAGPPAKAAEPAAAPPAPEVRVALVIGNSAYQSAASLPNPRRDAEAVAGTLRQAGFRSVELAVDLDRDAMIKALRSFRDRADRADWALIYFAGHGIEINGVNYLIPVDAKLADERDVEVETVPYEDLLSTVGGAKMLRLIILDACRVNPFKARMRRNGTLSRGSGERGLAPPPESEPGTLVVYSAKNGEAAADDVDGVNSPFARAFMQEVKVPGREVRRLFDYVRDDVIDATNKRQQPFTYGSLPGRRDFFFVSAKK